MFQSSHARIIQYFRNKDEKQKSKHIIITAHISVAYRGPFRDICVILSPIHKHLLANPASVQ